MRTTSSFIAVLTMTSFHVVAAKEYCQFESFNATCSTNQVIVMEEARYGRLQLGRCVTRDYGYIGCSANVLDLLDRSCSGQRKCTFVISTLRDLVQPCPKDLTSYLDATYKCVNVLTETHCNSSVTLDTHMSSVYLHSSGVTALTLPNDVHISVPLTLTLTSVVPCPVHVAALPGQHIEIVLYSFGSQFDLEPSGSKGAGSLVDNLESLETLEDFKTKPYPVEPSDSSPERRCTDSIHIVDGDVETSAGLCQTRYRRQVLYTTNSNTVYVYFSPTVTSTNSHLSTAVTSQRLHYLLKLEAAGCADLTAPLNAWVERFKDRVVVRCNFTQETWYMSCKGTEWIGSVTNCTDGLLPYNGEITVVRQRRLPIGLVLAIITGVILGILFGLIMLVSVLLFKRRQSRRSHVTSKMNVLLERSETFTSSAAAADYQPTQCLHHFYHGDDENSSSVMSCGQQQLIEIPHRSGTRSSAESQLHSLLTSHPVGYDVTTGSTRQQLLGCVGSKEQYGNSGLEANELCLERVGLHGSIPLSVMPHRCLGMGNSVNSSNNSNNIYSSSCSSNTSIAMFHRPDIVQSRQLPFAPSPVN